MYTRIHTHRLGDKPPNTHTHTHSSLTQRQKDRASAHRHTHTHTLSPWCSLGEAEGPDLLLAEPQGHQLLPCPSLFFLHSSSPVTFTLSLCPLSPLSLSLFYFSKLRFLLLPIISFDTLFWFSSLFLLFTHHLSSLVSSLSLLSWPSHFCPHPFFFQSLLISSLSSL